MYLMYRGDPWIFETSNRFRITLFTIATCGVPFQETEGNRIAAKIAKLVAASEDMGCFQEG